MSKSGVRNAGQHRSSAGWYVLAAVVIVLILVVAVWKPWSGQSTSGKELVLGAILPMSGNLGGVGQMEADGMRLAVEDLNAKAGSHGVRLKLEIDDSQGKPDVGATAVKKMMSVDGINVVLSSISSVTLAIKPVVVDNGGILIGCTMHPGFYRDSPSVFRFYEGVEQESQGFVAYFKGLSAKQPKAITGVLYADVPNVREQLDKYVRPEIGRFGMDFRVAEPYQLTDKEFRDKIVKIKTAGVTDLLILGYGFEYPNVFRALKEQRMLPKTRVVGGWGFLYCQLPKQDLEGITVVGPKYVFDNPPEVRQFYKRFKEKFGYEANFDAAMTYASIELLSHALRSSGTSDVARLSSALNRLHDVQTIIGPCDVDKEGALAFSIGLGSFHNGIAEASAKP